MANVVSSSVVLYFCPESSGRYCKSSDTDPQNAYFYAIILRPRSGPCFRKLSARRRGVEACRPRVASGPGRQPVGDRRPGRDVPGRDRRRFAARLPARDTRLRAGLRQRPYSLHLAVAPTKNVDRYEWFAEKATEIGVDRITPVLTDRCERRTLRIDRILRVVTGAMKQSLKAYLPRVDSPMPLRELLELPCAGSRLIAHCEESGNRTPLGEAFGPREQVLILIGPEGDFSSDEIRSALDSGFRAVSARPQPSSDRNGRASWLRTRSRS